MISTIMLNKCRILIIANTMFWRKIHVCENNGYGWYSKGIQRDKKPNRGQHLIFNNKQMFVQYLSS